MAIFKNFKVDLISHDTTNLNSLFKRIKDIQGDAMAAAKLTKVIPVLIGPILDNDGFPKTLAQAAFYCTDTVQIVLNSECKHVWFAESLRNAIYHEVCHQKIFDLNQERYLRIHQMIQKNSYLQSPWFHDSAINLFELVPRIFAISKQLPPVLLQLVTSDSFETLVQECYENISVLRTVYDHHRYLLVKNILQADTRLSKIFLEKDDRDLSATVTAKLAIRVEDNLRLLLESEQFAPAIKSLVTL